MNHFILTTSLSKINKERFRSNTLVLLLRMVSTRDIFGWKNCLLTILCRESLRYRRSISILWRREMIRWFPNQCKARYAVQFQIWTFLSKPEGEAHIGPTATYDKVI